MTRRGIPIRRLLLAALLLALLGACNQSTPGTVTLTVTVDGTDGGIGTVTSDPEGIDVTSGDEPATLEVATGDTVTLTATPTDGSTFDGWTGDCTGTDPCTLDMDSDADVSATFSLDPVINTVTLTVDAFAGGTAAGSVTSPDGIDVASDDAPDTLEVATGDTVTLTASATSGAFSGWVGGGCDDVTTATCAVTMDSAKDVTATFNVISGLTIRTGARTDDAMEFLGDSAEGASRTPPIWFKGWVWSEDDGFIDLGWTPYHNLTEAAFRFPGVTVPADAIVTSAVFQVTASTGEGGFPTTGPMSLTIEGEKSPDASAFMQPAATETPFDVTDRPRTDESVVWEIVDDWVDGDEHAREATAILQEIVDQADWTSGSAVTLFLKGGTLDDPYRRVYSFDSGEPATSLPTLLIDYVEKPTLP